VDPSAIAALKCLPLSCCYGKLHQLPKQLLPTSQVWKSLLKPYARFIWGTKPNSSHYLLTILPYPVTWQLEICQWCELDLWTNQSDSIEQIVPLEL